MQGGGSVETERASYRDCMADGDESLGRFLTSVEQRAFRMAQIATGNRDDALDIVQDAMLNLVRRYRTKQETEWRALFFKIVQSRIRDRYRRNTVRMRWRAWLGRKDDSEETTYDPMGDIPDPSPHSPAEQVMVGDGIAALNGALRSLPFRQQQVFLLRAWEGMSVRDTAAAMRCSEGSVKTHYSRAVHTLRVILKDHQP